MSRFIELYRFELTGGWSLWIAGHIHIYHFPAARRPYGVTWVA